MSKSVGTIPSVNGHTLYGDPYRNVTEDTVICNDRGWLSSPSHITTRQAYRSDCAAGAVLWTMRGGGEYEGLFDMLFTTPSFPV
jgi:hypothetical protein